MVRLCYNSPKLLGVEMIDENGLSSNLSATARPKQRHGPWRPGESGNPKGRAKGTRNYSSILAESLIGGKTKELAEKAIELALKGDPVALRVCIDKILPNARERP